MTNPKALHLPPPGPGSELRTQNSELPACYYPEETCPVHTPPPPPPPPPPEMPVGNTQYTDAYARLQATTAGVASGHYSPFQAARFVRSLVALEKLGLPPTDEDEALAEVELRGVLMHGLPPRDPEEWALAERRFNDEAIGEFRRWEELIRLRRAGIRVEPYIEAAEDAWLDNTDRLAREAAEREARDA